MKSFLQQIVDEKGRVNVARLSSALRVSEVELVGAMGVSSDAVPLASGAIQVRLNDLAEIINRVLPWVGSGPQAFAWYRAQSLPSFGDRTAQDLVKEGRAEAIKSYIRRIEIGGYA